MINQKLTKVVLAAVKGSLKRTYSKAPQLSAYTIQKAILVFYTDNKLFPEGLHAALPSVSDWALKMAAIVKKLVGVVDHTKSVFYNFRASEVKQPIRLTSSTFLKRICFICCKHGLGQCCPCPRALEVSRFRRLTKRAKNAKSKRLQRMKKSARSLGWPNDEVGLINPFMVTMNRKSSNHTFEHPLKSPTPGIVLG